MKRFTSMILAVGAATAFTGSAFAYPVFNYTLPNTAPSANYSDVNTNSEIGGANGVSQDGANNELPDVLARAYGGASAVYAGNIYGTWTITGGTLGANVITLTRVADSGGTSPLTLVPNNASSSNDSIWNSGSATGENLALKAIVAGDQQTFGYQYLNGTDTALTGSATNLFTNVSTGNTSTATISPALVSSSDFVWYDKPSNGDSFYSDKGLNSTATNEDHQITFQITENGQAMNGSQNSFLVCFEDTPGSGSDADYNDLVVEIDASAAVPVPASVWMGLVTMAGLGTAVALRRRSQMA